MAEHPTAHPTACEVWQPAIAGWLVAQLDPAEEAALDAHLATCAACRSELDSLMAVAAVSLGVAALAPAGPDEPLQPPADLGERILARVAEERRGRRRWRAAMAAGAAAAVVAAVLLVGGRDGADPAVRGEAVTFARVAPGAEAAAVVGADQRGSLVQLTASGLDPEVTYALWLTPPGGGYSERVPAGTFRPDAAGDVDVRLRSALPADEAARIWATTPDGVIVLDTAPE
jgi:predicted anti-sigma-YlaC factor YlaD